MRCAYCRSITHDKDCPKEMEDKILPLYSAIHKLATVEKRCQFTQTPLYAHNDATSLKNQIDRLRKGFVESENAKNVVERPVVTAKNSTPTKK